MLLLGLFLLVSIPGFLFERKYRNENSAPLYAWFALTTTIFSMFFALSMFIGILVVQIPAGVNAEKMLMEKEVIEYRLDNLEGNVIEEEELYQRIISFNKKVQNAKYFSDNIFIGLCFNDEIADEVSLIELP